MAVVASINRGDLKQSDVHEAGADRIGALGFADALGALLLRLKGRDLKVWKSALAILVKRVRPKNKPRGIYQRICQVVLAEWLEHRCGHCGGKGFVISSDVERTCPSCDGTRIGRHSDEQRMRLTGIDHKSYPKWAPVFGEAHVCISNADSRCGRQIARQLER
jgi:hypothetical protein